MEPLICSNGHQASDWGRFECGLNGEEQKAVINSAFNDQGHSKQRPFDLNPPSQKRPPAKERHRDPTERKEET